MSVTLGQTDRVMRGLTIGQTKGREQRRQMLALEGLQEYEDQFKIRVEGRAEEFPVWTRRRIDFNVAFIDASGHRAVVFDKPHFTYGTYVFEGGPIGLIACVLRWHENKRGETIGCNIGIGAVASDQARRFQGELHARFQGWGALNEQYGDIDALDVG